MRSTIFFVEQISLALTGQSLFQKLLHSKESSNVPWIRKHQ